MVFGWGKKNRAQVQKTEETVERSVAISDVSQIVTDTLKIHSKTIVSETSSLHSRMDNLFADLAKIISKLDGDDLKIGDVDRNIRVIVERGKKLILLTISAAINVVKFANPEKYEFVMPDNFTGETLAWAVFSLIGLDGSLASSVIIMLSVTVFLIFRTARMHTVTRYFIFTLSVVTFGVFLAARFTDFIPNVLQLLLYAAYQVGIALGAFAVSRRGIKTEDSFV